MRKVILILCLISLTGCIDFRVLEKWDNARVKQKYERERKAYYDKETPAQKALRDENRKICIQLAELPENIAKGSQKMDMILRDCMKERGSPLF